MTISRHFRALAAAVALVAAAGPAASADEKKGVAADLEHYFPIRAALAGDTLDGVKDHALALAKSADQAVAKAAPAVASAADLEAARKGFADLSKAMIAAVEAASKRGETLPELYIFECPMAKPYGRWLQETSEVGNPYKGQQMLKCGRRIGASTPSTAGPYCCPMCPGFSEKAPGKCPKCGMPLQKGGQGGSSGGGQRDGCCPGGMGGSMR